MERFECPGGWATISRAGAAILITMSGNCDATVGRRVSAHLNSLLEQADGAVRTFWDLEALLTYHSDVRVLCTQALLRNWAKVADLQTLATNRVVKMGVAVAKVALWGRLHNTEDRKEFEALLRDASR